MVERIGGVLISEIESVLEDPPDYFYDAGSSIVARFCREVSDLVSKRRSAGEQNGKCFFLCCTDLRASVAKIEHEENIFLSAGTNAILDAVWATDASIGTAFKLIGINPGAPNTPQNLINMGFGNVPALVIEWANRSEPHAKLFPEGIAESAHAHEVALLATAISESELKVCLDHFHQTTLINPGIVVAGHGNKVWNDAGQGIPAPRPEEIIQGRLMDHLKSRFASHKVRAEQHTDVGRYDLMIKRDGIDSSGNKVTVHEWLLELKAFCDKTSGGNSKGSKTETENTLVAGIDQAYQYRDSENVENAALCCYDMRTDDEGCVSMFETVSAKAEKVKVRLWRWFLFRSSAAQRAAAASAS